jgi:hypothetical protein
VILVVTLSCGSVWAAPGGGPANDDFRRATEISLPFAGSASTAAATLERDEPQPSCGAVDHTVWYGFTPAADTRVGLDSFGSDYDTVLAIYAGSRLSKLVEVACNDQATEMTADFVARNESRVFIWLTAGTTYRIQVGGWQGSSGSLVMNGAEMPGAEEVRYDQPATGALAFCGSLGLGNAGGGCVQLALGDTTLDLAVTDDVLGPVSAFYEIRDEFHGFVAGGIVCGSTSDVFVPYGAFYVRVWVGPVGEQATCGTPPALATTGSVAAAYHYVPAV